MEIPGYTVLRQLGRGGMAVVYLAVQQSLGREVALKVLSPPLAQDADARERFLREARVAASLHHPNIVPIHDVALYEDIAYIAMEFEPGGTVSPPAAGQADPEVALRIIREIATALDYAHARGVVHRDIKPENILLRADGASMLSDFGIARVIEAESALTRENMSIGTPQYMSPEQIRGEKVDGRSDLYSLGVVLYQLLTGELPFVGTDGWAIGMQHLGAAIPRLPAASARLQPLLDDLMAKSADARPQTGAEVLRKIDALLGSPAPTGAAPLVVAAPKARHFAFWPWLAAALLVLAYLGLQKFAQLSPPAHTAVAPQAASPRAAAKAPTTPTDSSSIAVLPFADMSQARDQGYFSDGMSEELLNLLAQVPGLHVAGRTSTLSFKGKDASVAEIGKALKVATLLEGSVRKAGDRMRVTVQLINVADGYQIWSQSYDRNQADVFAVQDDIAGAVVDALKLKLLPGLRPSSTRHHVPNFETYDKYLLGRQSLSRDPAVALAAFRQAVALDPKYAAAYASLAMAESFVAEQIPDATLAGQGSRRALAAAEQAVALDPELGDAYAARGYVRSTDFWDWNGALADVEKAIRLEPGDARNQLRHGYVLSTLGRLPESRSALEKGTEQDPLFLPDWYWLGRVRAAQGDYAGARLAMNRALEIEPKFKSAANYLGTLLLLQGDAAGARAVYTQPQGIAMAEHDLGHEAASRKALAELIAMHAQDNAYGVAAVYAWTGNRDQAFAWLDRAVAQHDVSMTSLKFDPLLGAIRADPRYASLLKRLKLPE
ncbi:MAG: protein kinase [Arenimonas sp.]